MYGLEPQDQTTFVPAAFVRVPHWKRQVERAVRELDPGSITARVHAAEEALFLRWQELGNSARGSVSEEWCAMAAGADELLSIKIHKLKWPNFLSNVERRVAI
jgi:hypothetical protein